jgi:hypothetical protein
MAPRDPLAATDMHAGESETSMSMIARPALVHLDRAPQESGADQARLAALPEGLYTGAEPPKTRRIQCRYIGDNPDARTRAQMFAANPAVPTGRSSLTRRVGVGLLHPSTTPCTGVRGVSPSPWITPLNANR